MKTPTQFFLHFKNHNGFDHKQHLSYEDEFERLAEYLDWGFKAYESNLSFFNEIMMNHYGDDYYYEGIWEDENDAFSNGKYYENDYNNYDYDHEDEYEDYYGDDDFYNEEEEVLDIRNCQRIEHYFDFYKENYDFNYTFIGNSAELFEKLARFMGWNSRFNHELSKFKRNKDFTFQKKYLRKLFLDNGMKSDYDPRYTAIDNFYYLSEKLGWNDLYNEKREEFDELVARLAKSQFLTLEKLHSIIRRYQLEYGRILPHSKGLCKKLIKQRLFVNIYDFIGHNKRQFDNLDQLRFFSMEKSRIFPKKIAKKDPILKILMHILL